MPDDIQKLIQSQTDFIISQQLPSGAIPRYRGGITDPWDHVECAMALDSSGRFGEASLAYKWMHETQNPDGSWYSSYHDDKPQDLTRDTNFGTYIATGMWSLDSLMAVTSKRMYKMISMSSGHILFPEVLSVSTVIDSMIGRKLPKPLIS